MPGTQEQQGGNDSRLTGALGQDGAVDPKRQAALLSRTQSRKALGQRGFDLIQFGWNAHVSPPASRVLSTTMMPEDPARSKCRQPIPYLPL